MANCFGDVIDNLKLDTLPRYVGKLKTQEDRARAASHLDNDDGKSDKASSYVHGVKSWYGNGASTLCLVYNQTGDTLSYVDAHDWEGNIGRTPYPTEIGNGQWAAFHHVHWTGDLGASAGAVIYRGKDKNGEERDFLLAWLAPTRLLIRNKAYCEMAGVDSFQSRWHDIYKKIDHYAGYKSNHITDECEIVADIAHGYSPVYIARIKIPVSK